MGERTDLQPATPPNASPILKAKFAMVRSLSRALAGTKSYQDLVTQLDAVADALERGFQAAADRRLEDVEAARNELAGLEAATEHTVRRIDRAQADQAAQMRDAIRALASGLDRVHGDLLRSEARTLHAAQAIEDLQRGAVHDRARLKSIETLVADSVRRNGEAAQDLNRSLSSRIEALGADLRTSIPTGRQLNDNAGEITAQASQLLESLVARHDSARAFSLELRGRLEAMESRMARLEGQADAHHVRAQELFALIDSRIVNQAMETRALPRVLFADENDICVKASVGYLLFPRSEINHALSWLHPDFDRSVVSAVRRLCTPGAHFIDIGSSIGAMSVAAAGVVTNSGSITLVDPISEMVTYAARNVQLNAPLIPLKQITAAGSNADGERLLQIFPSDTRISTLHPYASSTLTSEMRRVEVIDIASTLPTDGEPIVVKVDAEAEDLTIVARLLESTKAEIRVIYEHSPAHFERAGIDPTTIVTLAAGYGIEAQFIDEYGQPSDPITEANASVRSGNVQLIRFA